MTSVLITLGSMALVADPFTIIEGNACGTDCGCQTDSCKDIPGKYNFLGTSTSAEACEQACVERDGAKCEIFIFSANSKHCWERIDGKWEPSMTSGGIVSGCRTGSSGCKSPAPPLPPTPFKPTSDANMNGAYILSETPGSKNTQQDFPTDFHKYPGGVEYFDVYSPEIERLDFNGPDDPRITEIEARHGHSIPREGYYKVVDLAPQNMIPTSQSFGGANGGEYRKSFHGYAPGFAQVIDSPEEFQIDTWNRDKMSLSGPESKFKTGPLPRNSLAPPDAEYSGLLECPVTTRIEKVIQSNYDAVSKGMCVDPVLSADECRDNAPAALTNKAPTGNKFHFAAGTDPAQPLGCSARTDSTNSSVINIFFNSAASKTPCGDSAKVVRGTSSSLVKVDVSLDLANDLATITLTGPSAVWFGVGFGAEMMKDAPWAIIVDGNGKVTEMKLSDQGTNNVLLKPTVEVKSSSVTGALRNVVVTRPLKGASSDYYSFNGSNPTVNFINAVGAGTLLAFHKDKAVSALAMLPLDSAGSCVCEGASQPFGQGKGSFKYNPTNQTADVGKGTIGFGNRCAAWPRTDMLNQKNPTCDVRTYTGGQSACHHMFSLLDADQEIPWADQPLVYHQKFRYNKSYHTNLKRATWGIASPVEYDVPKCGPGVPACTQVDDGSWIHEIRGTYSGGGKLAAAHFHCHAPTCLDMSMYRCPAGTKVCNETNGELLCSEKPIYGGTGKIDNKAMDEPGYILQPPCLWGNGFGLASPPETQGYVLGTVKTSNATAGHHGEMAWQQMYIF